MEAATPPSPILGNQIGKSREIRKLLIEGIQISYLSLASCSGINDDRANGTQIELKKIRMKVLLFQFTKRLNTRPSLILFFNLLLTDAHIVMAFTVFIRSSSCNLLFSY
jgi:hypothetical protein